MPLLLDLTPLRVSPSYRRLWSGFTLSGVGAQLATVAIGLQVYDITRSTFAVGIVGLCALVPLVVMGLYGGAIVDHYDRRKVALAAGLLLQDFYEDWQPHPRFVIDRFVPTFLATCALKPRSAAG